RDIMDYAVLPIAKEEKDHQANQKFQEGSNEISSKQEEYTSKTYRFCGYVNHKLGGSKVFCCPKCKTELDRNINGARNILLRYLTKK
ncbi:13679_t:CDS:2, partial [Racocetra persica]